MVSGLRIPNSWLLTPLILLFFWLALASLVDDSPTMDEQNHLARGLAFIRTGDPRLSLEHPPLVNALSALPLLTLPDVQLPLDSDSWNLQPPDIYWYVFADQFLWHVNDDVTRMIILGRLPIVFLTLGLALTGFHFAREMWGRPSALLAFFLLLFEPNIVAHGRYITTDVGGTMFLFLATFLLWRLWRQPVWHWPRWLWAALGLGLAFSSKLSTLTFVPILALLALLPLYGDYSGGRRAAARRLLQLLSAGALSILVVWALFGFEWGPFRFPSETLAFLNGFNGPLPTFWAGIDQIVNVSRAGRAAFLLGEFSDQGFLAYFPVAFLLKTPLVILLTLPVTAVLLLWRKRTRRQALFLMLPAFFYFGLSVASAVNIGYRHLLPMLPFLLLLLSGLAVFVRAPQAQPDLKWLRMVARGGVFVLVIGLLAATLWIHPHYLSFFNLAAGGPASAPGLLADSNIDWGQDLWRLQSWMEENEVASVKLGWFGIADPDYYGLVHEAIPGFPRAKYFTLWDKPPFDPAAPAPGIYAISASSLWESHWGEQTVYPWFRAQTPDDRVGYSILIYEVP